MLRSRASRPVLLAIVASSVVLAVVVGWVRIAEAAVVTGPWSYTLDGCIPVDCVYNFDIPSDTVETPVFTIDLGQAYSVTAASLSYANNTSYPSEYYKGARLYYWSSTTDADTGEWLSGSDFYFLSDGGGTLTVTTNFGARWVRWAIEGQWMGSYGRMTGGTITTSQLGEPTQTPQPSATPLPQGTLPCVTATPTVNATPTPYATSSAATTATPTPTPGRYESDVATFGTLGHAGSLSPWYTLDTTSGTGWTNAVGWDGQIGVARLGDDYAAELPPTTEEELAPYHWAYFDDYTNYGFLILDLPASYTTGNIYISGYAKNTDMRPGDFTPWIWGMYYDADFDLRYAAAPVAQTGAVIVQAGTTAEVGSDWTRFGIVIRPLAAYSATLPFTTTHRITSVALLWGGKESSHSSMLYVDNLRVIAGRDSVPVCGYGGGGGVGPPPSGGVPPKTCTIVQIDDDVISQYCPQPDSWLDVGEWIAWAWCSASTYFTFVEENTDQVVAISSRQSNNEPIASALEVPEVIDVLWETINSIMQQHTADTFWETRTIDFTDVMDFTGVSTPPVLAQSEMTDISACDDLIVENSSDVTQDAACWVVTVARERFSFLNIIQWLVDGAAVLFLVRYTTGLLNAPIT